MQTLLTNELHYNKESRTFSAEVSDLGMNTIPLTFVYIKNPKTGNFKKYLFTNKDTDGEDTYGWNYRNAETNTKLLIIND